MQLQEIQQLWQQDEILQHLNFQDYRTQIKILRFLPQQPLALAEQELYFLLKGQIKMAHLDEQGKLYIYRYIQGVKVLNLVACIQKKPLNYHYFAMSAGLFIHIPQAVFLQALEQHAALKLAVINLLSARLWDELEQQRYQVAANLKQRIAYQLLVMTQQQPQPQIKISQQELADVLHISRQTLHRQLLEFLQLGFIEWRYHQVKILNVVGLQQWASL